MDFKKDFFFYLTGAALLAALVLSLAFTQVEISLSVNQFHRPALDVLCFLGTHLGDGIFSVVVALIFLFVNRKAGVLISISYLSSALVAQVLKRLIFADIHRPLWHLEKLTNIIYYVPGGAEKVFHNSFPSGHTTSAFALFSMLAILSNQPALKVLCFFLAAFVAFTRIYLLQHFLIDTMAGALLGTIVSYLVYAQLFEKGKLNKIILYPNKV
ncbi:MAG: phosphatase PAP2 family protein [Bacteroidetes bacterium]|jgi:membrane-associated phospholipid phosphatase|nr:phosphatase PAP2 family protein [Bacteroidota bacterium]